MKFKKWGHRTHFSKGRFLRFFGSMRDELVKKEKKKYEKRVF